MKPKYLLDECIGINWPSMHRNLKDFDYVSSVEVVGRSAKDEKVLEYAIKSNRILVTADKKLAITAIFTNVGMVYIDSNGKTYFMKPSIEKIQQVEISDDLTKFMSNQDQIIIP